ncbi:MAG: helix-turn-helix domain-containing protein [Pedobacter sp.]
MFKAKIRKQEEELLECAFESSDYPLVALTISDTFFKRRFLKWTADQSPSEVKKEEKFLLTIIVPQAVIVKFGGMDHEQTSELSIKPTTEPLSPLMRSIISDMLLCTFKPEFKKSYLITKTAELLLQILSVDAIDMTLYNWSEQDLKSLEKVRDLMAQNLKVYYSIEELAVLAGMNRTKLQQGFKNLFNKTIYTFLHDLKMTEAKTLLSQQKGLSLKEVAAMLGYKHVNHFSVAFKKKFDISPALFRKVAHIFWPLLYLL